MLHHYCTALLQVNKHEAARCYSLHSYGFSHAKGLGTNISSSTDSNQIFFVKIQHFSKQTILIGNIYLLLVLSGDSSYYRHVNRNQTACKVCLRRDLSKIHSFQTNIVQPGQLFFFFF